MELTPVQQIILTVLFGKEDKTAWKRAQAVGRSRAWQKRNLAKVAASVRAWRKKNSEKVAERARARYKRNPEKAAESHRAWRKRNPEKATERNRAWRKRNLDQILASAKRREKLRRDTDPAYRILKALRGRIWGALKRGVKVARTKELLGCTIPELRTHLEARFVHGMTWENYGPVWHIDHKRPCSSFDFSDPAQQRECFHYTNLQPLFAGDNLRKGDSWGGV